MLADSFLCSSQSAVTPLRLPVELRRSGLGGGAVALSLGLQFGGRGAGCGPPPSHASTLEQLSRAAGAAGERGVGAGREEKQIGCWARRSLGQTGRRSSPDMSPRLSRRSAISVSSTPPTGGPDQSRQRKTHSPPTLSTLLARALQTSRLSSIHPGGGTQPPVPAAPVASAEMLHTGRARRRLLL